MKVLYDYQIFEHQVYGGISRYFYEIIKGIDSQHKDCISYKLPLVKSSNHYIKQIPALAHQLKLKSDSYDDFLNGLEFKGKWKLYQLKNKLFNRNKDVNKVESINALKRQEYDLFHPTDNDNYFVNHLGNRPLVITVHDLIDEIFPEYSFHVHSNYKTSLKENLIKRADGIIAVSESTKNDILQRFNIAEEKVKVIYHGVSNLETIEEQQNIIIAPYFLFVGKRTHYKNFYFLLQCLQPFIEKQPDLKVVCVGAPFVKKEYEYFEDLGLEKNIILINASDMLLASLYKHAIAFIYPSLYEGFGLPVLEAFKCGCPVLLSRASSLPEVGGNAALYFDPKNIESVREAISVILNSESQRAELISKGFERVHQFTWEKTVSETLTFYKSFKR